LLVYNPAMLMIDKANVAVNAREFAFPAWTTIVSIVFTSVVGILALGAAVEGYFKVGLNWFWRIFLGAGALCMIIPETVTDIIGIVMVVI
ncbi:C4-dicarboxylate ABC transporter permease, partial [bacterium LRH843]|nr:C4-dicarboxylate ABC transporter permease [bacterium LRH843]